MLPLEEIHGGIDRHADTAGEFTQDLTAEVLFAMESDSGIRLKELRIDGGATRNDFFTMQFRAGVLGIPVVQPGQSGKPARRLAHGCRARKNWVLAG